jgi:hypothetical protein
MVIASVSPIIEEPVNREDKSMPGRIANYAIRKNLFCAKRSPSCCAPTIEKSKKGKIKGTPKNEHPNPKLRQPYDIQSIKCRNKRPGCMLKSGGLRI